MNKKSGDYILCIDFLAYINKTSFVYLLFYLGLIIIVIQLPSFIRTCEINGILFYVAFINLNLIQFASFIISHCGCSIVVVNARKELHSLGVTVECGCVLIMLNGLKR